MKTDRIFEFFASAQPEQVRLCARFNEMVRFPAVLRRILPVLFATVLCMACSDDDTDARPYLHVVDDLYEVNYDVEGGVQDFVMYSSYGHWTLQTTYAEDEEWLTAWPAEGDGDARFAVKVNKNDRAASRQASRAPRSPSISRVPNRYSKSTSRRAAALFRSKARHSTWGSRPIWAG